MGNSLHPKLILPRRRAGACWAAVVALALLAWPAWAQYTGQAKSSRLRAVGVLKEKNMYGKMVMGIARTTFLIGPDGIVTHIFENVKPDGHAEEVLAYAKSIG